MNTEVTPASKCRSAFAGAKLQRNTIDRFESVTGVSQFMQITCIPVAHFPPVQKKDKPP
jgi:hypothetical protein